MAIRIVLTGGGTGGHLFPLATVADFMKEKYSSQEEIEFLFIGKGEEMERQIFTPRLIPIKKILTGKFRRYFSWKNFSDFLKVPLGIIQSLWHLLWYMPDVVFSKGGYVSLPVILAARFYRIPVIIHESDAVPGFSNRVAGVLAKRIAISFERAKFYFVAEKTFLAGVPVRKEALDGDKYKAMEILGIKKESKPVVLFIGGSQGAQIINEVVLDAINELTERYQVIHQTGKIHYEAVIKEAGQRGQKIGHGDYYPVAFFGNEIGHLLALADVVVSRAGATAISEIAANQKPCILVPINLSANDHQRINAFEIAQAGGAIVLEEENFKKNLLIKKINQLMNDVEMREKMVKELAKFYHPDAVQKISKEIIDIALS